MRTSDHPTSRPHQMNAECENESSTGRRRMAGEPHGKGHPILRTDLKKWLENRRDSYREGTPVCSAVVREGAVGGPNVVGMLQVVHNELVSLAIAVA